MRKSFIALVIHHGQLMNALLHSKQDLQHCAHRDVCVTCVTYIHLYVPRDFFNLLLLNSCVLQRRELCIYNFCISNITCTHKYTYIPECVYEYGELFIRMECY